MNPFLEQLSTRMDATASDLKTSLHEHVDSTVDNRMGQLKLELASLFRSGVIECIRTDGQNQHWRVETTYTPVSPRAQHLPGTVPLIANQSTGFIQAVPPHLLFSGSTSAGMPATSQCIADMTFPSYQSMSIPLYDTNQGLPGHSISTRGQLVIPSGALINSSNRPNLNKTEPNTSSQSAQKSEQIEQNPLDGLVVTPMDQFNSNNFPEPPQSQQFIEIESNDDFCPCADCANTLSTNQG